MSTTLVPAPKSVVRSYWLYVASAAVGIIGMIVTLVTLPAAIDQATRQLQAQGAGSAQAAQIVQGTAIGAAVLGAVIAVVFAVLTFVFAGKMRLGRNWARVVLAVFAGLQLFGVLGAYGVGAVHFLLGLAALILSFVPESNAWFRSLAPARATA